MARRALPTDPFNDRSGDARRFFLEGIPSRKNPDGIKEFAEGSFMRVGKISQSSSFNQFANEMFTSGKMDRRLFMRHIPSFTESQNLPKGMDYPEDYFLTQGEILNMSPTELNQLMQRNAYTIDAMDRKAERQGWRMKESGKWVKVGGASNEGSFEEGDKVVQGYVKAWQDGKITNDDQSRTGSLIRTGMDGMDEAIPGEQNYNFLDQYKWVKQNPEEATRYVGLQYKRDLKNNAPSLYQKIFVGGLTSLAGASLFGPVLGAVGAMVGGPAGAAIASGTAIGAATGASTSAALGQDPLMGAIKGGVGGFILQDMGMGDWLMDKAERMFGEGIASTPEEAAQMIAEGEGTRIQDVLQDAGEGVHGDSFNINDSGAIELTGEARLLSPIRVTAPAPTPTTSPDLTGIVTGTVGGGVSGLIEGSKGEGNDMAEEGKKEESESVIGDLSLEDLGLLAKTGINIYDWISNQDDPEKLREIYEDAARRADPWAEYREKYAGRLDQLMDEGYDPLQPPDRQSPLDRLLANPFKSYSQLAKFIQEEETPLEYQQRRGPFETKSGLFNFLANTDTPLEHLEANPFQSQSGLLDLMKDPSSITTSPAYQFRLNQGLQALDRRLAAGGYRFSGNRMTALNDYAQQSASQEYENEFGRRQQFRNMEQDLYKNNLENYLRGYSSEADTRLGTYGREADQYSQEFQNYLRNYLGTLEAKRNVLNTRFSKYKDIMGMYSDQYNQEFERYLSQRGLEDTQRQRDINNLIALTGIDPRSHIEGQQNETLGRLSEVGRANEREQNIFDTIADYVPGIIDMFTGD